MAIHAASHRDVRLLEQAVSLCNFAMAGFASRARVQMVLVAEENVTRNLIDPHPGDRLVPRGERGHALNPRAVLLHPAGGSAPPDRRPGSHHLPPERQLM